VGRNAATQHLVFNWHCGLLLEPPAAGQDTTLPPRRSQACPSNPAALASLTTCIASLSPRLPTFHRSNGDLDQLFRNPRVHTGDGYHRKPARAEPSHPCPGCGKLCRSVSGTAGHFESGACPSCPGRDAALQAAYGQIRRLEDGAGSRGMFTSGQLALTDNYQMDQHGNLQRDWTGGYEHGGDNYSCPGCSRAFKTSQAMLQHIEARPQCRSGGFEMLGY